MRRRSSIAAFLAAALAAGACAPPAADQDGSGPPSLTSGPTGSPSPRGVATITAPPTSTPRATLRADFLLTFLEPFSENTPPGTTGYRFVVGTGVALEGANALRARLPGGCRTQLPLDCTWQIVFTRSPLAAELFVPSDLPAGEYVFGFTLQDGRSADAVFSVWPVASRPSTRPPSLPRTAPAATATTAARPRLPPPGPTPLPVPGSLTLTGSFPGIDGFDASIAVGPSVVVIQTNDFVEIREKSGQIVDSMSAAGFFGPVSVPGTIGPFDGVVQYDPRARRFFHVASTRTDDRGCAVGRCVAALYLAVSKSDSPRSLGSDHWHMYALDNTLVQDTPTDTWGDMNQIAVDDDVVVIATNSSAYRDDAFRGKKLRILEKAPLLRGEPVRTWRDLLVSPDAGGSDLFSAVVPYGDQHRLFFISPEPAPRGCDIRVWALDDPLRAPSLTSRTVAYPGRCVGRGKATQPSGPSLDLPGLWARPVHQRGSIWGASVTGIGTASGPAAAVRWFEIDVRAWPDDVRVVQEGALGGDGMSYMYPSIAVDPLGKMALAFLRSGPGEYVSAAYSGRFASDPPGTLRPAALLKAGDGVHDCLVRRLGAGGGTGLNKVSDYTGMALDLTDGSAWMLVHYVSTDPCIVPTWLGRIDWSIVSAVAQSPRPTQPAPPAVPEATPVPVPGTLTLTQRFAGVTGTAPFWDGAPGPAIAAGPSALVLSTSDRIELRGKDGVVRGSTTLLDFYTAVRATGSTVKNPFVLYDPLSGRFFHVASSRVNPRRPGGSRVLVAVSRGGAPETLDPTDWYFYSFAWTLDEDGEAGSVFEYGRVGLDAKRLVVTARTDPINEAMLPRAVASLVDKAALLRGEAVTSSTDFMWPQQNLALNPVRALDPLDAVYLLSRDGLSGSCGLTVWRIDAARGAPERSSLTIPGRRECFRAADAPQPEASRPLDITTELTRLDAVYRSGSIWGVQTVSATGGGEVAAVRWFQIDVSRWPDGVRFAQEATISADRAWLFYPSITVHPAGHAAVILARSSPSEFASLFYTGRLADDPPNTMRPLALLGRGTGPVACVDHTSGTETGSIRPDFRNRFAFQSGAALDPADGSAWLFGQYGRAGDIGCQFATWVGRIDWSIVPSR